MRQNSFSPRARWDRFQPDKESANMQEPLNERIDCLAYFKNSRIFPKSFTWNNREYQVETITYNWQERLGQALVNYFSVLCANQLYQISFNNSTFRWQIDKIL